MNTFNIMTSCDENLLLQVGTLLQSIADNLPDANVNFYLLHGGIADERLDILARQCTHYPSLFFHAVQVDEPERFEQLASKGGRWCGAAYYSFMAHSYLPEEAERVLYLDAGDTLVLGDISPYYNADFNNNVLIVTGGRWKLLDGRPALYAEEDLYSPQWLPDILSSLFNAGSYVINLTKMRAIGYTLDDYLEMAELLARLTQKEEAVYFGDEGIWAAAFVGHLQYFRYPEICDPWYMPYNFCMTYPQHHNSLPPYRPQIVHFMGNHKPWLMDYPIHLPDLQPPKEELHPLSDLYLGQAEYYFLWHEYAIKTCHLWHEK